MQTMYVLSKPKGWLVVLGLDQSMFRTNAKLNISDIRFGLLEVFHQVRGGLVFRDEPVGGSMIILMREPSDFFHHFITLLEDRNSFTK